MSSEKNDELFDYFEKIYYLHQNHLYLRNLAKRSDTIESKQQVSTDPFDMAFDCNDEKICLVQEKRDCQFILREFNPMLKMIGYKCIKTTDSAKEILNERLGVKSVDDYDTVRSQFLYEPMEISLGHTYTTTIKYHHSIGCHDIYTNTWVCLVDFRDLIGGFRKHVIFVWAYLGGIWVIQKKYMINIFEMLSTNYRIFCSRNNIIIRNKSYSYGSQFGRNTYVFDKITFQLIDKFDANKAVFFDDYDRWKEERLKQLADIMTKMPIVLLKIILFYVA